MINIENQNKIKAIKKYYKKYPTILELTLTEYEHMNMYIILNYYKKTNTYRLSYFLLDKVDIKNIESYLSCTCVSPNSINAIREDFANFKVSSKYFEETLENDYLVNLKINISTGVDDCVDVVFRKYLPKSLGHLIDIFIFIFRGCLCNDCLPLLHEILAQFTDSTSKFEYKKEFNFNLFTGDIDKLFNYQIVQRGKKYYEESRVTFLEKTDDDTDKYIAVVEGTEKYIVLIRYKEDKEIMQVYCTCPCEFYCKHMYAVILAIRNKEFNRFYKITYKNPNLSLLDRIMNFDYYYCLGVVEQNLEIVNNDGEIELVPILDKNGKYNWEVLEDSENEDLTKEIKYFLDNN